VAAVHGRQAAKAYADLRDSGTCGSIYAHRIDFHGGRLSHARHRARTRAPGEWDGPGWGRFGWDDPGRDSPPPAASRSARDRSRENRIEVNRFVGDDATALGHGAITVASQTEGQDYVPQGDRAAYEAAVVEQLVHAATTPPMPCRPAASSPSSG
jgi:hypothetical protein